MDQIIKIKFIRDGKAQGRAYSYYAEEDITVGDIVSLPIPDHAFPQNGYPEGLVVETNVAESEVASFKSAMKHIIGRASDEDYPI